MKEDIQIQIADLRTLVATHAEMIRQTVQLQNQLRIELQRMMEQEEKRQKRFC